MEFPTCTVTAVLMPGCWVKDFLSLLWLNTGDATSCPCPALLEVRFPDRPTCCLPLKIWQVSLSVSSSQKKDVWGGKRVDFLLSLLVEGLMFPVL